MCCSLVEDTPNSKSSHICGIIIFVNGIVVTIVTIVLFSLDMNKIVSIPAYLVMIPWLISVLICVFSPFCIDENKLQKWLCCSTEDG